MGRRPRCSEASAYTPVPGGVGPLTIAMLMEYRESAEGNSGTISLITGRDCEVPMARGGPRRKSGGGRNGINT